MIATWLSRGSLPVILLAWSAAASADSVARDWLHRISQSGQTLNYDGVFVYQHDKQLQSMRVLRKVERDRIRERLVSLNGAGREVIRDGQELRCYLPDTKSVLVEQRKADSREFPNILPKSLEALEDNYQFELGPKGRIADRMAQSILIRPKDGYRYGYRLWADEASSLLLMASLLDPEGNAIEQFMFTQVRIGPPIRDADLEPSTATQGLSWFREDVASAPARAPTVTPGNLPSGFILSARLMRKLPTAPTPLEHLVYSDGLAVVSVFVQRLEGQRSPVVLEGLVSKGAANVFGRTVDGHHVTVIGEVPAPTVQQIGESLTLVAHP